MTTTLGDRRCMGMLIAIEGIDGAGKRTLATLLQKEIVASGLTAALISFPRYGETLASVYIERYLAGGFGDIGSVPPPFTGAMYALDRFESRTGLLELLGGSDVTLVDRYVASNLAYQGSRLPAQQRGDFIKWLFAVEHELLMLPQPNLTIYLDLPAAVAADRIAKRRSEQLSAGGGGGAASGLTPVSPVDDGNSGDIYEASLAFLEQCRQVYGFVRELGLYEPWLSFSGADTGEVVAGTGGAAAGAGEAAAKRLARAVWKQVQRLLSAT